MDEPLNALYNLPMRARASYFFVVPFALACLGACTMNLANNARDQGRASMSCEDAQYKMRVIDAERRRFVVYGCGSYEVYEGSCNGEKNGCDSRGMAPDCDGSCRVRRQGHGELTEAGEIPEGVLKGEELDEDE